MKKLLTFLIALTLYQIVNAQCPPPGFPEPGNTCPTAPILCANLDGYCATINNNNTSQSFPGCPGWTLNNDEWFAFFAGSTTISVQVTPTNCNGSGGSNGLQGGIYSACTTQPMDLQCSCTTSPFTLTSSNFVVGQVYWMVLDGCNGAVCNYSIDVTQGSTVGVPPANPGPITAPMTACQGTSTPISLAPVTAATQYAWTITPANLGTISGNGLNPTVNWSNVNSGTATICVTASNLCYSNPTPSCTTVDVIPKPTATISGSGQICTGSGNSVNLTVTFTGTGPWNFVYAINGAPQPAITVTSSPYTLTATQPGTYTPVSVSTVSGNCAGTVSGSSTVTQVTLNLSAAVTNTTCGVSNGAIDLSVTGGTTPYTYGWSSGQSSQDLNNIPAGTYTVTVTSNNGCSNTATYTVNDNVVPLTVTGNVTNNTTCAATGNGAIDISITPPPGTYVYTWSGGQSTQDLNNLPPGTYSVTVSNGPTCTGTGTFTVNDNPNKPVLNATTVSTTCDLSNGSISLSATGGQPPFTYSWSNGSSSANLSNIAAGAYTVVVTGANSCTETLTVNVVNNNPPITINGTPSANTSCNPTGNGSVAISVSPAGTYTYSWSNGSTSQNQSNLSPGTYTVVVTGAGSCSETASFTIPDQPNNPAVFTNTSSSTCDLSNGSVQSTVSGGVGPFTFSWSNGASTQNLNNVPAGTYTVIVTGGNGCTGEATATVANNNPPINVNGTVTANTTCNGGNGSITLAVTPSGAYTYSWSTGSTTPNQTGLAPGTYTVVVTGQGSCSETADFTIPDQPLTPNINYSVSPSFCDLPNGSVSVSVSGGQSPYTYSWSNGSSAPNQSGILASSYGLTVTGANGCTNEASIDIPNNNPAINISETIKANTLCNSNGNGSITLIVTPANTYTYAWDHGPVTQNVSNLLPGTYTVTVSAGGSCTQEQSFEVPDDPNAPVVTSTTVQSTCDLFNGRINLTTSGGQAPYTYSWSNGSLTQNLVNVLAGTYTVTVTGANGCSTTLDVELENNNPPIFLSANIVDNTLCIGGNGRIDLSAGPPLTPPQTYSYSWSTGDLTQDLNNLLGGSYGVTVSAGGSCIESDVFTVNDDLNRPEPEFIFKDATCGQTNGSIDLSVTSGQPPYTYSWSNGATTQDINNLPPDLYLVTITDKQGCTAENGVTISNVNTAITLNGTVTPKTSCLNDNGSIALALTPAGLDITWSNASKAPTLANLAPGNYTVTVSAGGNCTKSATFTVADSTKAPVPSAAATGARCGLSNGSIDLSVSGGVAPYTYSWSTAAVTEDLANLPPATYTVTVTSAASCTATASATVPNSNITISLSGAVTNNTSCAAPNGAIALTATPTEAYTYSWSQGATNTQLNNLPPGSYSVTVTLGPGCSAVSTYQILQQALPPNLTMAPTPAICGTNTGAVAVTASGGIAPFVYNWSTAATGGAQISSLPPGNYSVTVTDAASCSSTASATVLNNDVALALTAGITDNSSCVTANGGINLSVSPASGAYNFTWSNSAKTEDLNSLTPGNYSVTVTAGVSCSASSVFTVNDITAPPVIQPSVTPAICSLPNGAIDLSISGPAGPYTFAWSNSAASEDLSAILPGNYSVTVTAANGCQSDTLLNVANNSSTFSLSGTATPRTDCAKANGSIDLVITPAGPYTIKWSNGAVTEDLQDLEPGVYTVSVTESGSCTASASYVVDDNRAYPLASASATSDICDLATGTVVLQVTGGTTPYAFKWTSGQSTQNINNLTSGQYAVTVTTPNNCTTTATATVPSNTIPFSIAGVPTPNTSCVANNGAVNITLTPSVPNAGPGYSYSWSNAALTEDVSDLAPGLYTVTVSAGGSCTNTASYSVVENAFPPVITEAPSPAFCGDNSGAINITVTGGLAPYSYSWSTGATTQNISALKTGPYSVTVTDAGGCKVSENYTLLENIVFPSITPVISPNTACFFFNGAVSLNVTPSLTYTYTWAGGQTTPNIQDLPSGTYTVTVSAGGSCTSTAAVQIVDNVVLPALSANPDPAFCGDNSGGLDLSVNGGAPPYTFKWNTGSVNEDINALVKGSYTVTVTDDGGCNTTGTFSVPEDVVVPNIIGNTTANTACVNFNGAISLNVSPTLPYSFVWGDGQTTPAIQNLAPGSYTVTVSAGGSCTETAAITVPNSALQVPVTGTIADVNCFGASTGSIKINTPGAITPLSYNWAPVLTGDPTAPGNLAAGQYTVTVTDGLGCTGSASFTVKQPQSAVALACTAVGKTSSPTATDGSGSATISGGVAPYAIEWTTGLKQSNLPAGKVDLTNVGQGSYGVTVTDANGCTADCSFSVTVIGCDTKIGTLPGSLTAACGPVCISLNYDAVNQFLEPGDKLQFVLHQGSATAITGEIARSSQPQFCFNPATMAYGTTYYVTAVAGNADPSGNVLLNDYCTVASLGAPIVFRQIPVVTIASPKPITCALLQIPLTASSSMTGTGFAWSTVNGQLTGTTTQATATATAAGLYTLIGTVNGCADTTAVSVNDIRNQPKGVISANPSDLLDCIINEIILSGTVEGSTNANTVWVSNNGIYPNGTVITINQSGLYAFVVLDTVTACRDTASIFINEDQTYPSVSVGPPGMITCTQPVVTLVGSSPFTGIQFTWSRIVGTDTLQLATGTSLKVTEPGTYLFTGIDPTNKCRQSEAVTVTSDLSLPVANAGPDGGIDCYGQKLALDGSASTGSGTLQYQWSTTDGRLVNQSNTAKPLIDKPGTYTLKVTNALTGCTDTDEVVLTPLEPRAFMLVVQPQCFGGKGIIRIDSVAGAEPPVLYSIDNGKTFKPDNIYNNLAPGDYTVQVKDVNDCATEVSGKVIEPKKVMISLAKLDTVRLGDSILLKPLTNLAANEIGWVKWDPVTGLSCPTCLQTLASPKQATRYSVILSDTAGCTATAFTLLAVDKHVDVYAPNVFTPDSDGDNNTFTIYADSKYVLKIKSLRVYSRWGEMVFERLNFPPSLPEYGWKGDHRNDMVDPAVFVWTAILELADGQELFLKGDVTVVR